MDKLIMVLLGIACIVLCYYPAKSNRP